MLKNAFDFFGAEKYVEKQSSCLAFPVSIVKVQRSWLEEAVGQIAIPLDSWIIRPQPSSNMKMIKGIIRLSSFNITIYILYIMISINTPNLDFGRNVFFQNHTERPEQVFLLLCKNLMCHPEKLRQWSRFLISKRCCWLLRKTMWWQFWSFFFW